MSLSPAHLKLATAVGGVAAVVTLQRLLKWRESNSSNAFIELFPRPSAADWLSKDEYAVLLAVCDAFCPSLEEEEVEATLRQADIPLAMKPDEAFLRSNMGILKAGALNRNVHEKVLQIILDTSTETEKAELKLLFWLLSTTVGCFALVGMAAPFQCLSLENRVTSLQRLMNSYIPDMRIAYQTLKRLTLSLLMDTYTEEGASAKVCVFRLPR